MKITLEWLEALLARGWRIRGVTGFVGSIEFRDPQGISGDDYQCGRLDGEFPAPVAQWIRDNIPATICKHGRN